MTLNDFKQICEDYGLTVIFNQICKNEKGEYTYARAFYKNEVVVVYDKRRIYCYNRPIAFRYDNKTMMIDNGESTDVHSDSELEENIIKAVCNLKKLLIRIKKFEIEKEFE